MENDFIFGYTFLMPDPKDNSRLYMEQAAGDVKDAQALVEEVEPWLRKQNPL